ncbi:MAG: TetM/TetW/TetO/TetS family tetracycline resistance ribosomal protection protein [Oscillospiraceae bacterium]|nr:TetM/TetW/TetO/TetS family tetracycline resistance ribosomal protection protein [Oscillospiraceae bacterium]
MSVIGILAHVDAGKTTLSEQILFRSGQIRSLGRVDHQSAFFDSDAMERARGITIFSGEAPFSHGGRDFFLLDTPGHADFSGEMQRALWVMDCAVLVISAPDGIQSHTASIWRLLRQNRVPTVIFLNKTDQTAADPEAIRQELEARWELPCIRWEKGDDLCEELALLDEEAAERFLTEDEHDPAFWTAFAREQFARQAFLPVLQGSALKGEGIDALLDTLADLAPSGEQTGEFSARVYKVTHDKNGRRQAYLKVTSGTLTAKRPFLTPRMGEDGFLSDCAGELRLPMGARSQPLKEAKAGDICMALGLEHAKVGDVVGAEPEHVDPFAIRPLLVAGVLPPEGVNERTLLGWLRILEDEDPLLSVRWDTYLSEATVWIMGRMQLDVLRAQIADRFGAQISFTKPRVLYMETIAAPVHGCGHYEPLRHYAEVHLRLEPGERGSGITFVSECPHNDLATNWQRLIRTHVFEKEHVGVLTGMPLTDVKVVLLAGRAHLKHTEGGDFRESTYRAIRHGLMNAENVLLEPWYAFEIEVPVALTGRILTDIDKMKGRADPPESLGETTRITGTAPASEMMDYPDEILTLTRGQGRIGLWFSAYEPCHNTEAVVEAIGYDPERDLDNPPGSVFCSHGAGFTVNWREAEAMMHIRL